MVAIHLVTTQNPSFPDLTETGPGSSDILKYIFGSGRGILFQVGPGRGICFYWKNFARQDSNINTSINLLIYYFIHTLFVSHSVQMNREHML